MSNNITIMNERDKRIVDNIDMANSVLIFVNRIEIIAANNDSAVDDTIDTKVSPITFVFFELSLSLLSTITAANPNNIVNTSENTVVRVSANEASIWYCNPKTIKTDIIIGEIIKHIKSHNDSLFVWAFLKTCICRTNSRTKFTFLLINIIIVAKAIIDRIIIVLFIINHPRLNYLIIILI